MIISYHHYYHHSKAMLFCRHQLRVMQVSCLYVETYLDAKRKHASNAAPAPAGPTEPIGGNAPSVNNYAPSVSCVWSVAGDIVCYIKGLASQVSRAPNAPAGRRGTHTCISPTSKRTILSLLPQAATNERMAARGAAVAPAIASSEAMRRISTSY